MQAFDTEVSSHLVDLAPLLLEQLDAMTDRMVDVLSRTEPAYRDFIAESEEELRRSTRDNLEHGLLALVGAPVPDRPAMHGAREVGRIRDLGATEVQRFDDDGWVVLADPDGNQFCVVAS